MWTQTRAFNKRPNEITIRPKKAYQKTNETSKKKKYDHQKL